MPRPDLRYGLDGKDSGAMYIKKGNTFCYEGYLRMLPHGSRIEFGGPEVRVKKGREMLSVVAYSIGVIGCTRDSGY